MTEQEMDVAFEKALAIWEEQNDGGDDLTRVRYFFWAGSEFGLQSAQQIYGELLKK